MPICRRLLLHCARLAASRTFCTAGNSRPMSTARMAITTKSSIRVKAQRGFMDVLAWVSLERHQEREQVVQLLDGQLLGEVLGHERALEHGHIFEIAFEERMKLAILLAELNAEVGLVDAQAD